MMLIKLFRLLTTPCYALRNSFFFKFFVVMLAFLDMGLVQADAPAVSNDPTKAQQPAFTPPPANPVGGGFELPPIPKQNRLSKSGNTLQIKHVDFKGNTVVSNAELSAVAEPYLNRDLTSADFEELRRKLTMVYVNKGYLNSGAKFDSQSLGAGKLTVTLVEGRLVEIRQKGLGNLRESYLRERLLLGAGNPLNVNQLQDRYRLLLSDPMIKQLNGALLPGNKLGEAVLDVAVTRARPYQFYAGTDNYQTPSIGGYTGRFGGWADNYMTLGERIDGQFSVNDGSLGYNTGISLPVSARDTRVSFRYSDTYSTIVEASLASLNIKNNITGFDAGISHPVYQTPTNQASLLANFTVRKNASTISGHCLSTTEGSNACSSQVTVIRLSQHLSHLGATNYVMLWSTFNVGLNALGATVNSRGYPSGQFFSWLGQSMFTQRLLANGTALVLRGNIQLAESPLLNLERYSLGGVNTVRGYRENTYVRDNGFNATLEFKIPVLNNILPEQSRLFLVPFTDFGGAWDNPTHSVHYKPLDYLQSFGVGFNWQYQQVSTDFYWGHAIDAVNGKKNVKNSYDIQDDGIHFRVNMNAF